MFMFQADDGIRALVRSRGIGEFSKRPVPRSVRQIDYNHFFSLTDKEVPLAPPPLKNLIPPPLNPYQESLVKMELADILVFDEKFNRALIYYCLVYASDAADDRTHSNL